MKNLTERKSKKTNFRELFRISNILVLVKISNSAMKKDLNFTIFLINYNNRFYSLSSYIILL